MVHDAANSRAVVEAPKFCHVTPILKSLHWLKINEHIEYKLLSLTYKTLATAQPSYLHSLISVQPPRATRSSSVVSCHPFSTTYIFFKNHQSLISLCIISGINFLSHSASLAQNTLLMMSHSVIHLPPAHHSYPPPHIHCFIPG